MIGRLAERRKKLPQVRDNDTSESEYSSECQAPCSPPTETNPESVASFISCGGGEGQGRGRARGDAAALEFLSLRRELLQISSLNLSVLRCLRTRAKDSSSLRASSSPLGSFIPSGDSSLISLFSSFFSCPEVSSVCRQPPPPARRSDSSVRP